MCRTLQVRVGDRRINDRLLLHPRCRVLRFRTIRCANRLDPIEVAHASLARRVDIDTRPRRFDRCNFLRRKLVRRRTIDLIRIRPGEIRPRQLHALRRRLRRNERRTERRKVRRHALRDIGRHLDRILHRLARITRPVQELIPVIGHGLKRDLRTERIRSAARYLSAALDRRRNRHHDPSRLRERIGLARNDDLARSCLASLVVRIGKANRPVAGSGVIARHNRNPRLRDNRAPDVLDARRDRDLARTRIARHPVTTRRDVEVVGTLGDIDALVADVNPSDTRRSVTRIRGDDVHDFRFARPRIVLVDDNPRRIGRNRRPRDLAVRMD